MIEARLVKRFVARPDTPGFSLDVTLKAASGVTVLFGPSGAGKTLILDCIAGFVRPDSGRILLDERILFDEQSKIWVRPQERKCGYVFQNYALFPHMTIRENLLFAADSGRKPERRREVQEVLERFQIHDVSKRKPHEISGGQKQRCSIARALLNRPRVLLLDEPARGLDAPLRAELYELIREVRREYGTPALLVTHNLDEAFELADEMIVVHGGSIVQSGSPAAVCGEPANLELARLLGIYNVIPAEVRALDPSRDSTVLRLGENEIRCRYLPGLFNGDRVHILVTPAQLRASERMGRLGQNQIPAQLQRAVPTADGLRLEFAGGLRVNTAPGIPIHNGEWAIEFPSEGLRFL